MTLKTISAWDVNKLKRQCPKCAHLLELYEATPKTPRLYWVMSELFTALHGGDVCEHNGYGGMVVIEDGE